MDKSLFAENATGMVVRLDRSAGDWAFIPNEMPPSWEFDNRLWELLSDAREALGELNGIGQTLPDPDLLLRPLKSREAISSSSIEGTYVTPEQLLLYEMNPIEATSTNEKRADWMEVFNYSRALSEGCEMLKSRQFTHHMIRSAHATLMHGVRGRDKLPGQYRDEQVQIGSTAGFVPPPPPEVNRLMDNLVEYVNAESDLNPLVKAFVVHYQFEAIHPFKDGNGRLGRVLLSIMVHKWQGHTHPWLYLSPFFERFKDEYIRCMFEVSTVGNWSEWIAFCLRGVIAQSRDAIARCARFRELREALFARVKSHTARTHNLIENLFRSPVIVVTDTAKKLGITYPTARADIDKLVNCSILKEFEGSRPKAFYSPEIMEIAYRESLSSQ